MKKELPEDWYINWEAEYTLSRKKEKHKRRLEYERNNLDVRFDSYVESQTYQGYINYYSDSVDFFIMELKCKISSDIDTVLYSARLELECRAAKIKKQYCI